MSRTECFPLEGREGKEGGRGRREEGREGKEGGREGGEGGREGGREGRPDGNLSQCQAFGLRLPNNLRAGHEGEQVNESENGASSKNFHVTGTI